MRSLFLAVAVLGLAAALLSRSVWAEAPTGLERRELKKIVEALKKKPALKAELASVRFAGVLGIKTLQVPERSSLETVGAWGENWALFGAEETIAARQCGPLTALELEAASVILAESAEALPVTLRAFTLGQQGKTPEAADLLAGFIAQQVPELCPGEPRSNSQRRVTRIAFALKCLQVFAPKRDTASQLKTLKRAQDCADINYSLG